MPNGLDCNSCACWQLSAHAQQSRPVAAIITVCRQGAEASACAAEQWGKQAAPEPQEGQEGQAKAPEQEPNFGLSGALAKETNTLRGVELLHTEPPEARKPTLRWRLYIFKNGRAPQARSVAAWAGGLEVGALAWLPVLMEALLLGGVHANLGLHQVLVECARGARTDPA